MGRSSGKKSRPDVENERGAELMADLCVSMMHGAIERLEFTCGAPVRRASWTGIWYALDWPLT
jgi:hypothetical protein